MSAPARRQGLPLRVSLVLALVALVALGLVASGVAATTQLAGFLGARTDGQLISAAQPFAAGGRGSRAGPGDTDGQPFSRYYVAFASPDGTFVVVRSDPASSSGSAATDLPAPTSTEIATAEPYTVRAGDGQRWRAVSFAGTFPEGPDAVVTVATPLADDAEAITRLREVLAVIGVVVLALLAGITSLVVRRSLRPLGEVERTAAAIAGGDLDARVPVGDPGTEVGRLSLALNGMLAQIQGAVDDSAASAERAVRSEERMRRFVGDASHELRTPLTTIRGFAELYRQGAAGDPAAVARLLERIEGEARRMGVLVEDLLQLARLDAQRPLEHHPVDLLALAADAVHDARAVAPGRRITLQVLQGPGTPEVRGDAGRLRQVLGNLVANALTHTPDDAAVTVRVGTRGDDAVWEVADTGPGMAAADAERAFERFYRADTSRTRASGGTGLGLSIVDALVTAHGGTVGVRSEPGAGTTFTVALPRREG